MIKVGSTARYIKGLIVAAVLLPLIFIAEVVYVEQHQSLSIDNVQKEELDKLRAEAATAWLANQTAHLRGIAKLNSVLTASTSVMSKEFQSLLEPGTGLLALGYADANGNVVADTSQTGARSIKDNLFFSEPAAGREYVGQISGTAWEQEQDVVILATPVYSQGERIGVIYGVISKAAVDSMAAKLIPATIVGKPAIGRWLVWLGGVYLVGVIPLLFAVCFLRRQAPAENIRPVISKKSVPQKASKPALLPENREDPIDRLTKELARVSKKFEELEPRDQLVARNKPTARADVTPAIVIDRVLANAAYKSGGKPFVAKNTLDEVTEIPKNEQELLLNDFPATQANPIAQAIRKTSGPPEGLTTPTVSTRTVTPVEQITPAAIPLPEAPAATKSADKMPEPDTLTGLPSRADFEKIIAAHEGQPDTAIIMFSLDGIKVINDFLGKKMGDEAILAAYDILKIIAGEECLATRSEDKFVALLTGVGADMLEDVKKDIKYYLDLHNLRKPELPLSITIGAAPAGADENLKLVWRQAEADLDRYKAMNRVEARRFIMWSIKRTRGRS